MRELWGSRVKTFVPVLALRQAREILREQDWLVTMEHWSDGRLSVHRRRQWRLGDEGNRETSSHCRRRMCRMDDQDVLHL